jgi:hypothetical protein
MHCPDTGRWLGVFRAAGEIEDREQLDPFRRTLLRESLDWFNAHLKVPTLDDGGWRAVFWFRPEAREMVSRLWEVAWLLRDEGVDVRMIRCRHPGRIIYADRHQIAAVPERRGPRPVARQLVR